MPRVLVLTPYAQLGGSERQLLHLVAALPPDEIAGVVVLQDGPLLDRLEAPIVLRIGARPSDILRAARAVRRVLRDVRPDVVHASCAKGALVAGMAAVGTGTPVLFVKHDFYWDGPLAWFIAVLCQQVVAASDALNGTFPRVLRRRLHVVHPGVPAGSVDRDAGRRRVRALTGADHVVALVGRLHPDKGHLDAIEAVEKLSGVQLLIIGDVDATVPSYRDEVRARASECVTLAGPQENVVELLAGCDAVVVPSLIREGFGLVPVEAFRAGIPVVAYAHGALPEVIGSCGYLVPPGDRTALAAALEVVVRDADERQRLITCGTARADQFTVEAMVSGMRMRHVASMSARRR